MSALELSLTEKICKPNVLHIIITVHMFALSKINTSAFCLVPLRLASLVFFGIVMQVANVLLSACKQRSIKGIFVVSGFGRFCQVGKYVDKTL